MGLGTNYSNRNHFNTMAIIYWKIDGKEGHGKSLPLKEALSWVKAMNKKYGAGTHWVI